MATIEEALNTALGLHQSGQLPQAETIYRRILEVQPQHASTLHLLGAACLQQRRATDAIGFLEQAVALTPENAEGFDNLGGAYQAAERWQDSIPAFRHALQLDPANAKFHFDLGNTFKALGQQQEAIECFESAVRLNPKFLQAINNLGTTLTAVGRLDDAIATLRSALALKPDYANAQNGLGNALLDAGQGAEAIRWLKSAVALKPNEAKFHCNLGVAQKATGDPDGAYQSYQAALQLQPNMLEARKNLANLFLSQQRTSEAIREFEAAVKLAPNDAELLTSLADGYRNLEDFEEARALYANAAELEPDDGWLKLKEAFLCRGVFESEDDIHTFRNRLLQQLQVAQPGTLAHINVEFKGLMPPFGLTYHGLDDRPVKESLASLFTGSFPTASPPRGAASEKAKIGFVVTNGHQGIFLRCMAGIVDRLNRDEFEVWIVAPAVAANAIREGLTNPQTQVLELPDRYYRMVNPLRRQQFDLLYHWECGTDLLNYFLPFARLATVQCTGWGLPVTSGIPAMDFYLSNKLVELPDASAHYSEQLYLADTFLTWQEPVRIPSPLKSRAELGYRDDQHLYVCAQNLMKLHPNFDEILREILQRDSAATIVLVEAKIPALTDRLRARFENTLAGAADRVQFRPRMDFDEYLSLLSIADVALDPLYYGSGITAYEIFSCGTPLVTLPTKFRRGRFVAACYQKMGVTDCVATDEGNYVEIACRLAESPSHRAAVSASIEAHRGELFCEDAAVTEFERALNAMLKSVEPQ
ncbi:tetratricopeptide repeat protein [Fuerstiella marisgermanici]|uniref:protein O-GlcNAc transferase n=1 Tax=Fuerstiella marisgermanici TaxID=1891926 RepID=A0A1P8WET5_9PLAN|nr:tetratricopeptide repeat protein [Fuerstiella marisgermanici]APZ92560.1 lipoprotein [Fuerstiella marisgermanici]